MVVDVRYHLASLIGVFLALGLGILIGTSINNDGNLLREQAAIIDTIENQLGQLRTQTARYKADLSRANSVLATYRHFADKALPQLVEQDLADTSIAVVSLQENALTTAVETLLKQAGANICGVVELQRAQWQKSSLLASTAQVDAELAKMLASALSGPIISTTAPPAVPEGVRWLIPATGKADAVVVVGSDQTADLMRRVAAGLHQKGLKVTAIAAGTGWSRLLRAANVPIVEDVATPWGQLTLVEQLAGGS